MSEAASANILQRSAPLSQKNGALLPIAVGGLVAGTIDLLQACILFGWKIPLVIAAGLLGRQAVNGGTGTYALGVFLHFFIACSAASIYYAFSRKLTFMKEHWIVRTVLRGSCRKRDELSRAAAVRTACARTVRG